IFPGRIVLALFGASAGGHLTGLAAASNLSTLAGDLSTSAGLILGKDLSSNTAFRDHITANLKLTGDSQTAANAWLDGQLNAGAARGDILATAVDFLSTLADTTSPFYAAAQAFQTTVTAAVAWSTGAGATQFGVAALRANQGNVEVVTGSSFTLTTGTDTFVGTAGNDTFTGTSSTLAATDAIVDNSTTDNDTATFTLTADNAVATVSGVENVNYVWNAYSAPTIDLSGVTAGKEVTVSSSKVGYLGSGTVSNAGTNKLVAGDGMVGTVTVTGAKSGSVITADKAATVDVTASTLATTFTTTVNAATATTVNVTNFAKATVNAPAATAITVDDNGKASAETTLNVDAATTITVTATNAIGTVIINTEGDDATTVTQNDIGEELIIRGTGDFTLNSTATAEAITNEKTSGTLTVKSSTTGATDVSEVQANSIWFTGIRTDIATVADGANLRFSGSATDVNVSVAGSSTTDSVTATVTSSAVDALTTDSVNTVNVVAAATARTGADLTIADMNTEGFKFVFTGTNDVTITDLEEGSNGGTTMGTVDASALVGNLIVTTSAANENLTLLGSTGDNTVTTIGTTSTVSVTTQAGDDTVTASTTTGSLTVVAGEGENNVVVADFTTGTLVVNSGAGDDTVDAGDPSSGTVNLSLGDGDNTVTMSDAITTGSVTVTTGAGEDTITIGTHGDFAGATVVVNTGAGDDTITWSGADDTASTSKITIAAGDGDDILLLDTGTDWDTGTITLSGIETIRVAGSDDNTNMRWKASNLSGQTYTMQADGTADEGFTVVAAATTTTIDLSKLNIDRTIDYAVSGTAIDASAASQGVAVTGTVVADTVTGSAFADTIVGGRGADVITAGAGNDSIDVTETTATQAADSIVFNANATNGIDTITGLKVGSDTMTFAAADTSTGVAGAATLVAVNAALVAGASAVDISGSIALTDDVVELTTTLSGFGDLSQATDGTELLKALSSTSTSATQITTDNTAEFILVAYQGGKAYVYYANATNTALVASEIQLMGVLEGITAGTLTGTEFALV
ncbi:hypothetical protein B472_16550, partial [Limnohabitans sp. Rim28]